MLLSKCAIYGSKKSRFIKKEEASGILSSLGLKSNTINKFLLAEEKFMPEIYLKQPGFTYSACVLFAIYKERTQKLKKEGYLRYIYRNELYKTCFQHDIAYRDFKYLAKRTAADKVLRNNAFNIAKDPKYDGYQRGLASAVYKFFDKRDCRQWY